MSTERSTTSDTAGSLVLPLTCDDVEIGGKARSLARLAALGLPTPPGFAIGAAVFRAIVSRGPKPPQRLRSAADLAALDAARDTLATAKFPPGFEDALTTALDASIVGAVVTAPPIRFAVRSSAATEDRAGALGAGIYASILRVPRAEVPDAVRRVLASFLTPAAWVYSAQHAAPGAPPAPAATRASVLIHSFVDGDSAGTAAFAPAPATTTGADPVRIDVRFGEPTAKARERVEAAAQAAAARFGPIEIEWVADGDDVTFLQLRAYDQAPGRQPPAPHGTSDTQTAFATLIDESSTATDGGWTWDAAHNPGPLSPAQAGLVALVDACCVIGIRQQVIHGYLFWKAAADPTPPADATDARAAFDHLRAHVEPRLAALGSEPSLAAALDLYVAAYQPLFGIVGPACRAARKALAKFLADRFPDHPPDVAALLAGVPSVADRRRVAAMAIAAATSADERQAAIHGYLRAFGDESPRWDVAEPTLRETPERLLLLGATPSVIPVDIDESAAAARADKNATTARDRLPSAEQARFAALLAAARAAIAVGEDDDALFARLQAGLRRALLGLGRRLVAAGRLDAVDDVFHLPLSLSLSLARALDDPLLAPQQAFEPQASIDPRATDDPRAANLRQLAATGRGAFHAAGLTPPPPPMIPTGGRIVRGLAGAGGRTVGRVVHHPASTPLHADAVLIAATLLPTELPLLSPAAIVVETGEVLGHVAAQARERGIPAVVAATGARAALPEGATVVVDGDRGQVIRLDEP